MPIPDLKREDVANHLRRRLGPSVELTELPAGEESRVYLLVAGGTKQILRVNRSRFGFDKDAFAYRHFHSTSLPIPAVLETGDLDGMNFFCITSCAPGRTLQDLSLDEVRQTFQPLENILRSVRGSDVSSTRGSGFLDQNGIGSHQSWPSFLQSLDSQIWPDVSHVIDTSQLRSVISRMLSLSEDIQEFRCLIHGDFGSNNVLTDGRSITAVIDWSEAMIGDPLYDVANIFFWRTWLGCMDQQARFFEEHSYPRESAQERLLCYQLHIGLREMRESAIKNDWVAAAWAMNRLTTLGWT